MADKKVTQLTQVTLLPDGAKIYAVDTTRAVGDQDVQIEKSNLVAGGGTTPTLQEVTDVVDGNVTTNNITTQGYTSTGTRAGADLVNKIGDYDISNEGTYLEIDQNPSNPCTLYNSNFVVEGDVDAGAGRFASVEIGSTFNSEIRGNLLTANRNLLVPDASGTIALEQEAQTATGDGTTTIDWELGNMFNFQFGAFNETFTFTTPAKAGTFILKLVQDSVGSRTATFPANVKWIDGIAPTLTTTATIGTDIITFYFDSNDYFAVQSLNFS